MVHTFQGQPAPLVRDRYRGVLDQIMAQHRIPPTQHRPSPAVPANASFAEAVQNTDWFCWWNDTRPLYRYRRYREVLGHTTPSGQRGAHVDIGCGAGLFSWAFLDRDLENNLPYDRIDLYGLDHSRAMIRLAQQMRRGLMRHIPQYPELRYTHSVNALLRDLSRHHFAGTDYTITFGHVLAQAPNAIPDFARVAGHVVGLLDAQSNCVVLAVDAQRASDPFAQQWNALLDRLSRLGIQHHQQRVRPTWINDDRRAKIAWLTPAAQ